MQQPQRKILAHRVIIDGTEYPMAVATIRHTGNGWTATATPFERECEATEFHSGTVIIDTTLLPEIKLQ